VATVALKLKKERRIYEELSLDDEKKNKLSKDAS
jgi:hypothetical protein